MDGLGGMLESSVECLRHPMTEVPEMANEMEEEPVLERCREELNLLQDM